LRGFGRGASLLTQELNPIDGGCRIVSADVYERASPKFQAAGNRPFDRKVREAAQLTAIPTFVNYKRSSAHNLDFETVITTNLEKLSELDRQDTTSGHVCESPRDLIHRWAQRLKRVMTLSKNCRERSHTD
jgi:hypothetical protein